MEDSASAPQIDVKRLAPWITCIRLVGEHDMLTAPNLALVVSQAFADGPKALVFDLTAATFIDSSVIHVLFAATEQAAAAAVAIQSNSPVRRVLQIANLLERAPEAKTIQGAVRLLSGSDASQRIGSSPAGTAQALSGPVAEPTARQ